MVTCRTRAGSYLPAVLRMGVLAVCCAAVLAAGMPAVLGRTEEEPAGALGPPIDATDTDVYVNQFLKAIVAAGDTQDEPLPAELRQKEEVTFTLDTTVLSDGWHILSYHAHSIDHRAVPGFTGNQLASEVKIPICVDNQDAGACPPARAGHAPSVDTYDS